MSLQMGRPFSQLGSVESIDSETFFLQTHHTLRLEHHVTELTKHMAWPATRETLGKSTPSFGVTECP